MFPVIINTFNVSITFSDRQSIDLRAQMLLGLAMGILKQIGLSIIQFISFLAQLPSKLSSRLKTPKIEEKSISESEEEERLDRIRNPSNYVKRWNGEKIRISKRNRIWIQN